ncbi:MAG: thioredoxin fold domain-containing protein [Sulfuricurvum sp.]|nr:thioredoxin fold domain-containing protein [Sulfuricurvum sp.]
MKKVLLLIFGIASVLMANEAVVTEFNALDIIKEHKINVLKVKDEGDIYVLKGETTQVPPGQPKKRFDFYVTKDKKILIMGNAIYTDTKEKVAFPMDKNVIEGKEAFSYGTGGEVLYVFIDPECPYCKQFEKKMATLKNEYTFKIYLFPLPFHPNAIPMSKWILKGKESTKMGDRLIAIANGSTAYKDLVLTADEEKQLMEIINKQIGIGEEAEVKGTPTVLDSEFNKVNWPSL